MSPPNSIETVMKLSDTKQQEARRAAVFEAVARFSDAFADTSDEELERGVAKALAEARAELRAERAAGSGA